ncbi:HAD family hydrolase [Streptomyces sp. 8L]|uniref:HAD family hydrolase n=1 Tax=Streptomyces sp. 8L TaxID=2877242 RepID=UPI001CD7B0DC|nr:HAD family hydrolase [Streptomyces sp. 8L]MCA1220294.1 HAD family hydrolase [Streptomyces sp. 8L]
MGNQSAHLVWDWNGTLFDDIEAVLAATNASFAEFGMEPLTLERYRELYCVPVPVFYERLAGRRPTEAEWLVMDEAFHRHYTAHKTSCGLAEGAADLLAQWSLAGRSQSLCSLYAHEELLPVVGGFGIDGHFIRVDGRTGPSGVGKSDQMARHVAALTASEGVCPERTVVIGDALDDALAARHVGARAVLYTGGSNSRASLATAGVPVVDTLSEAVETAYALVE